MKLSLEIQNDDDQNIFEICLINFLCDFNLQKEARFMKTSIKFCNVKLL